MTGLGRGIDWSLAADTDRELTTVDLTRLSARGGGIDLTGSGRLATAGQTVAGHVDFAGSASGMRTGIAAIDALIGNKAAFAGTVRRDAAGAVTLDHVALAAVAAKLSGDARFDPVSDVLAGSLNLDVPQLKPLSTALGAAIAGTVSAKLKAQGPLDRLQLQGEVEGSGITAGGATIDRFQLTSEVADLSQRQGGDRRHVSRARPRRQSGTGGRTERQFRAGGSASARAGGGQHGRGQPARHARYWYGPGRVDRAIGRSLALVKACRNSARRQPRSERQACRGGRRAGSRSHRDRNPARGWRQPSAHRDRQPCPDRAAGRHLAHAVGFGATVAERGAFRRRRFHDCCRELHQPAPRPLCLPGQC